MLPNREVVNGVGADRGWSENSPFSQELAVVCPCPRRASYDLSNTKTTILGATPGAVPQTGNHVKDFWSAANGV